MAGDDQQSDGDAQPRVERLVVVSNRLPIVLSDDGEGGLKAVPGAGGLVTALAPVLGNRGGLWIGWPGTADRRAADAVNQAEDAMGYRTAVQGAHSNFMVLALGGKVRKGDELQLDRVAHALSREK